MADQENQSKSYEYETSTQTVDVDVQDRGIFDFGKKKEEEKPHGEAIATEFDEKVKISQHETSFEEKKEDEGEKKHSLLDKLHRSDSSSSSSSDEEEEGERGEKKKKKKEKKGLKEKIRADQKEEVKHEDTAIPVERVEVDPAHPEEKKGFLDKIKEKLPGQHKKTEDVTPPPPPPSSEYEATHESTTVSHEGEAKEKKGFLEKIKEKLPGYHPKTEEEKEKEKEGAAH